MLGILINFTTYITQIKILSISNQWITIMSHYQVRYERLSYRWNWFMSILNQNLVTRESNFSHGWVKDEYEIEGIYVVLYDSQGQVDCRSWIPCWIFLFKDLKDRVQMLPIRWKDRNLLIWKQRHRPDNFFDLSRSAGLDCIR